MICECDFCGAALTNFYLLGERDFKGWWVFKGRGA